MTDAELLKVVERLKFTLVNRATGSGISDNNEYVEDRKILMSSRVKQLLPRFVLSCRTLDEFWGYIQPLFGKYAERRTFLKDEFSKLLDILEQQSFTNDVLVNDFKEKMNSDYLNKLIESMIPMQKENPTDAIGKAKELIESVCKTILEESNVEINKNWDVNELVGETVKLLELVPNNIKDSAKSSTTIKQILGNLRAISSGMAELRNPYGSGHGKSASFVGLQERHAKLAVGSAATLVNFLWDTYECRNKK